MIDSSTSPVAPQRVSMRRAVSRWEIVGFSVNDVIGSGVYLLPAAAAAILGWMSVGAVVLAGFAVLLLVLCFAEAGSYFDRPGSAYVYTREAFGDLVGFEVGWMTWLARVASVSSLSVGFARAVGYLWPAANVGRGQALAIILPVLALTWINIVGVKSGVRTAVFLAITKTLPLLIFIFVGIFYVSRSLATSVAAKPGAGGIGDAVLLLLYAYAGFENTAAPAGEFKNPRRDVPFALIVQIVIVTLIYTAVQWVALGTLPGVVNSATPLAAAAARFLPWGGLLMTVGGVISILGTNGNTVLSGPRYLFALARDGFGPRFLGTLHPRYRTPTAAILVQTAIALPLAFTGSFEALATLSTVARLATYFGTALAVPVLRRKLAGQAALRLPGGPVIPIAAALLCVAFAASAKPENLIAGAIALVVGGLIYAFWRRPPAPPDPPNAVIPDTAP